MTETARLVSELRSNTCPVCRRNKVGGQSLCRRCYFKLPQPMRAALYNRIGEGYEAAHDAAMEALMRAKDL